MVYKTETLELKDQTIPEVNDRILDVCRAVVDQFGQVSLNASKPKRAANSTTGETQKAKIPKLTEDDADLEIEILSALKEGRVSRRLFIEMHSGRRLTRILF